MNFVDTPEQTFSIEDSECQILDRFKRHGFVVFRPFLARALLDEMAHKFLLRRQIHPNEFSGGECVEDLIRDARCYGVEYVSPVAWSFSHLPTFTNLAASYLGRPQVVGSCMLNIVEYSGRTDMASGGGWHRDKYKPDIKCLMYLEDVEPKHGSFKFIPGTRSLQPATRSGGTAPRFSDKSVDIFCKETGLEPIDLYGEAGTCVLFDSSLVHRGGIISEGRRIALTTIYMDEGSIGTTRWLSTQLEIGGTLEAQRAFAQRYQNDHDEVEPRSMAANSDSGRRWLRKKIKPKKFLRKLKDTGLL